MLRSPQERDPAAMQNLAADHARTTVKGTNGLVATGHRLATEAGLQVLRDGGRAADAAIAAAAVSMVVLPHRTSIGGDVFALVYDARTKSVQAYNGSGRAPASLDGSVFGTSFPSTGAALATIPGALRGWDDILREHGRFGLDRLLAPAIKIADDGFAVSPLMETTLAFSLERLRTDPECTRMFLPNGRHLQAGDVLRQPELARTLRAVAKEGPDAFYRGAVAEALVEGTRALGGWLSVDDLAAHVTDRVLPISVTYRGLTLFGQPPVSVGHVLLEEFAILQGLDLTRHSWGDSELVHLMVETKKLAFEDRDRYAGDPQVVDFDPHRLLDPSFVASRRAKLGARAATDAGPQAVGAKDTTYIAIVDADGNAVSLIESIYDAFGAATMIPGTGVLLNDRLTGFSLESGSPNFIGAGKRPIHTLNSMIALDNGELRYVIGTPGRDAQVQTNFQVGVALMDFDFDVQEAINAPRWLHRGGALQLESRFPTAVQDDLRRRGHEVKLLKEWATVTGGSQVIKVADDGSLLGGADPRREGIAAAV